MDAGQAKAIDFCNQNFGPCTQELKPLPWGDEGKEGVDGRAGAEAQQ